MRFIPRVLRCNAARCALTPLFLSFLATPIALSQDAAKAKPKPHVSYDGPALTFDFPGVKVGVAEYEEGPTGTTVLYFPNACRSGSRCAGRCARDCQHRRLAAAPSAAMIHSRNLLRKQLTLRSLPTQIFMLEWHDENS